MNGSFAGALEALRAQFLRGASERMERIGASLLRLSSDPCDRETLAVLRRDFHGFAGAGTTYGFPLATAVGLEGEAACDGRLESGHPVRAEDLDAWRDLLERLREDLAAPAPTPSALAEAPARPRDVLVVDDDEAIRVSLDRLGHREGYAVRAAASAAEALAEICRQIPDAALIELQLPDGSGEGLVERLRGLPGGENTAVLMMSAAADFLERVEVIQRGADAFFEKPLDWDAIARRLTQSFDPSSSLAPRIVSVEDDPDQAAFLTHVLETAGYEVRVVPDPKDLETTLISFRPDLVLMDVLLPGVSGYDLARYLRQDDRYSTMPILFLTTERQLAVRIETSRSGGDEHLLKPIEPRLLLSAVAARIHRARLLKDLVDRDGLTRLLTHTAFLGRARTILSRSQRRPEESHALVVIDLDHFKSVNDRHGHPVGDRVLSALATLLRRRLRQSDTIGRLGGEEFAVILEDLTGADAWRLMERLRDEFGGMEHVSPDGSRFRLTFSAGIAMQSTEPIDLCRWVESADRALYRAKGEGRNRVVLAG